MEVTDYMGLDSSDCGVPETNDFEVHGGKIVSANPKRKKERTGP
jgi:hypothetical protein